MAKEKEEKDKGKGKGKKKDEAGVEVVPSSTRDRASQMPSGVKRRPLSHSSPRKSSRM